MNVFLFLLCRIKLRNSLCPLMLFLFHFFLSFRFLACLCSSAVEQWAIRVKRHFLSTFLFSQCVDNSQAFSVPLRNQRWAALFQISLRFKIACVFPFLICVCRSKKKKKKSGKVVLDGGGGAEISLQQLRIIRQSNREQQPESHSLSEPKIHTYHHCGM